MVQHQEFRGGGGSENLRGHQQYKVFQILLINRSKFCDWAKSLYIHEVFLVEQNTIQYVSMVDQNGSGTAGQN